jgi:hypothetical protein
LPHATIPAVFAAYLAADLVMNAGAGAAAFCTDLARFFFDFFTRTLSFH